MFPLPILLGLSAAATGALFLVLAAWIRRSTLLFVAACAVVCAAAGFAASSVLLA